MWTKEGNKKKKRFLLPVRVVISKILCKFNSNCLRILRKIILIFWKKLTYPTQSVFDIFSCLFSIFFLHFVCCSFSVCFLFFISVFFWSFRSSFFSWWLKRKRNKKKNPFEHWRKNRRDKKEGSMRSKMFLP